MATVIMTCPTTGKDVSTGFDIDKRSWDEPTNTMTGNSFQCPACGTMHTWDKKDARLRDDRFER